MLRALHGKGFELSLSCVTSVIKRTGFNPIRQDLYLSGQQLRTALWHFTLQDHLDQGAVIDIARAYHGAIIAPGHQAGIRLHVQALLGPLAAVTIYTAALQNGHNILGEADRTGWRSRG